MDWTPPKEPVNACGRGRVGISGYDVRRDGMQCSLSTGQVTHGADRAGRRPLILVAKPGQSGGAYQWEAGTGPEAGGITLGHSGSRSRGDPALRSRSGVRRCMTALQPGSVSVRSTPAGRRGRRDASGACVIRRLCNDLQKMRE